MLRKFTFLCYIFISINTIAFGISHTVYFSESDFTFRQEEGYDVVEHPECSFSGEEGAPQLLVTSYNFIIPVNNTVESITINSAVLDSFSGSYLLFPKQPDDYYKNCIDCTSPDWVEPDSTKFSLITGYPNPIVELQNTGFFNGANHIATISVQPVSYRASDSTLYYYSSINFTLNIGGTTDGVPIYPQIKMRKDQEIYDLILENTVENTQDIASYGYTPPQLSDTSIALDNPVDVYFTYPYVIITRDSLVNYWKPYVDWLNRKGMRAGIMSMETIVSYGISDDPQVDDHADLLRGYLKYADSCGTSWVILGGGSEANVHADIYNDEVVVPPRFTIDRYYDYYEFNGDEIDCESWFDGGGD